jgi:hypothetical protein
MSVGRVSLFTDRKEKAKMGFMKIITSEGVQDMESMSQEELLGLMVAFMAEKDK